jgi:hypothetical protein
MSDEFAAYEFHTNITGLSLSALIRMTLRQEGNLNEVDE